MSSKHRNERVASLKKMRFAAGSQWSSLRRGVTWSCTALFTEDRSQHVSVFSAVGLPVQSSYQPGVNCSGQS